MRSLQVLIALLAAGAAAGWGTRAARAEEAPAPAGGAPPIDAEKRAQAKAHFDAGITAYNLGDFDKAIEEFKVAYELSKEPSILFNIAQAYRLKEDYKQALYFYRTYLRLMPDAPNRADVEKKIADLEALIADQQRVKDAPPSGTLPQQGGGEGGVPDGTGIGAVQVPDTKDDDDFVPPPEPRDESGAGRGKRIGGLATAGAGVALVATGIYFGLSAGDKWDEINRVAELNGTWTQELHDKYRSAESDETISLVMYVAGGAAIVGGGLLWWSGWKDGKQAESLSAGVVPLRGGGAGLVVGGSFW